MANIWKTAGLTCCLLTFGLLGGCANFVGGNLGELLTDANLNSSHRDLENYKFDLLPAKENSLETALQASKSSRSPIVDSRDDNSFMSEPAGPVIQLQPVKRNIETEHPSNDFIGKSDNSFVPRQNQLRPVKTVATPGASLKPVVAPEKSRANDVKIDSLPNFPTKKDHDFSAALQPSLPEKRLSVPPPFASHPPCEKCDYKSDIEKIEADSPFLKSRRTTAENEPLPDFVEELINKSLNPDSMLVVAKNNSFAPKEPPTESKPITWSDQLQETIEIFESEIEKSGSSPQKTRLENSVQLLRSMRHNLNQTLANGTSESDFWIHQIRVLNSIMDKDTEQWPVAAANALAHLNDAAKSLREDANLKLNSVAFCRKVSGFGQYETFETSQFAANQKVLVYCEIENFVPSEIFHGAHSVFETRISSSFWIKDSSGNTVQNVNFPAVTDQARKIRSDFFMHIPIQFENLRPGKYELQLDVHDLGSGKNAQLDQPLRFSIR